MTSTLMKRAVRAGRRSLALSREQASFQGLVLDRDAKQLPAQQRWLT